MRTITQTRNSRFSLPTATTLLAMFCMAAFATHDCYNTAYYYFTGENGEQHGESKKFFWGEDENGQRQAQSVQNYKDGRRQ